MRYIEGELGAIFPHGGTINAVERLRGLHLDGAAMDEFPLLSQQVFSSIVRPALADYHGWAVVAGTPMGDTNFYHWRLSAPPMRGRSMPSPAGYIPPPFGLE
jgi:hypothetical protein